MIDKNDKDLSFRKQCKILAVNKSRFYYKGKEINGRDIEIMNLLDEQFLKTPFYGVRRMTKFLQTKGYNIGRGHTRTLLRKMGLLAIYPKKNLSKRNTEHQVFPYLLNDMEINKTNQVWSADITYIRLDRGFVYMVAIIDWYSRYILSWKLSNTLDADFCLEALKEAINNYGTPEIFNTDQGCQFTSNCFIQELVNNNINISMDGKGRALDNIFVERFWRSLKYENIYINHYGNIPEAKKGIEKYINFYNFERFHQSLDYKTPGEIHLGKIEEREVDLKLAA